MRILGKDDKFAKANGYKNANDFPQEMKTQLLECFGDETSWLLFDENIRDFVAFKKSLLN